MSPFIRKIAVAGFGLGSISIFLSIFMLDLITFIFGLELMVINYLLLTRGNCITEELAREITIFFGVTAFIFLCMHIASYGWFLMVILHTIYWFVFDTIESNLTEKTDEDK